MEKTKSRKHTKDKINVHNEGEVFILSPDILQKLGISLGEIGSTPQQNKKSESKNITRETEKKRKAKDKNKRRVESSESIDNDRILQKDSVNSNKLKTSNSKSSPSLENALISKTFLNTSSLNSSCEIISAAQKTPNEVSSVSSVLSVPYNATDFDSSTSIVETAMLMKKSVFLSPSFCDTDILHSFNNEIAQEEVLLPEDIGINQNVIAEHLQEISMGSESFDSSDSSLTQKSETIQNSSLVSAKDNLSETDEDIPLSKLRMALLNIKSRTMTEVKIPISFDSINMGVKEETSLNIKGKNKNENIRRKIIENPVENGEQIKLNKDISKICNEIQKLLQDTTLESNNSKSTELITNGEDRTENVGDDKPIDNSSNSNLQLKNLHTEDVNDEGNSFDNSCSTQVKDKDINNPDGVKNNSKIKIICEEIIDSSQLKEIKIPCGTTKLSLTPVSLETKISKDTSSNVENVYSKKDTSEKPKEEHNVNTSSNSKYNVSENKVKKNNASKDTSCNNEDDHSKKDISENPNVEHNLNTDSNGKKIVSENKVKNTKVSKDIPLNGEDVQYQKYTSEKPNKKQSYDSDSNEKQIGSGNKVRDTQISQITSFNSDQVHSKIDISEELNLDHNSEVKICVSESKVKEIADYLSQIIKRRNSEQIIRDETKISLDSKKNKSNSKLSTQGVEKPGGGESNRIKVFKDQFIKTYSHASKYSKKDKKIDFVKKLNLKLPIADIDCKGSSLSNSILQEWCICSDFGKLDVYCETESYEHIHFWYHQNSESKPEILYNIYNEDELNKNNHDSFDESLETDIDEPEYAMICWRNAKVNEQITENEDNFPLEVRANLTPCSSDVKTCDLKSEKHDETLSKRSNKKSPNKYDIKTPSKESLSSSPLNIQSSCLNINKFNMAKQRVTRNSLSVKEDSNLTNNNNVKDDPVPYNTPHSITRRRSIRLSFNESNIVTNSSRKSKGALPTSKNSSVNELEIPMNHLRKSANSEEPAAKTKNKTIINEKVSETINRIKNDSQKSSKLVPKKSHIISDTEKSVRRTRSSINLGEVNKNTNNPMEDSKASENTPSTSLSINKMPVNEAEKSMVQTTDNKSSNNKNQLVEKTKSKGEILNKNKALSSTTEKIILVDKDKPAKHSKDYCSVGVDSSSSEPIHKTKNVNTPPKSALKSASDYESDPKRRSVNSINVEAANNHNEPSISAGIRSSTTKRLSQRNSITANDSESPAKRIRQSRETVEIVAIRPAGNVSIKQEIKAEDKSQPNIDSIDEPGVCGMVESGSNNSATCGVCSAVISNECWLHHLKSHNYLAWKDTERPLDLNDREKIRQYLHSICRDQGGLYCSKCGIMRKYPKPYLNHIDKCDGTSTVNLDNSTASALDTSQQSVAGTTYDSKVKFKRAKRQKVDEMVKCGVCKEDILNSNWIEHIRVKHQYMAKREGEIPLDENDEEAVKEHLYNISRYNGGLICNQCGTNRRYVKVYLDHIKACQGLEEVEDEMSVPGGEEKEVICGVCKLEVPGKEWYTHIRLEHRYMAWIEGQKPLNVNDQQEVLEHLQNVVKRAGRLYCWHCNEPRKIAKVYLQHVTLCEESGFSVRRAEQNPNLPPDQFECGVCHEIGKKEEWKKHAMTKHYNVAWMAGDIPINIKNIYAVDKYLKEYHVKQGTLVCKICGLSRSSTYGFYAHVLLCGKSDEEVEELMNHCDICNKKYVCIYKNQHMAAHRDAVLKRERKEREEELKKEKEQTLPNGKRRAAAKAQKVMSELITDDQEDGQPPIKKRRISDESEDSLKMEDDGNESESPESEVNSDLSDEENDTPHIRIRKAPLPKIQRIPFKIDNPSQYLRQSFLDYQKYHLTNESLFNEWRHTQLKLVPDASKYIPTVHTSCKVRWDDGQWDSLKRFDSKRNSKSTTLFAGGCIQCMSWVPEDPFQDINYYLSISTHRGPDVPRYDKDKIVVHPGLIQIWSFGDFKSAPELVLGLAHSFGTIWAMDWCPSGARDPIPSDCEDKTKLRLGLLAVACSNGNVYVISVPYPHDVNNGEMMICEAHIVVELRLHYNPKSKFQATSICWTPQKGHNTVLVGYADGTTALFDLNTQSPLLKDKSHDNNVTVIYPFLEKKTENAPISALSVSPTLDASRAVGAACCGGATGVSVWGGDTAAARATLRTAVAARAARPAPLWPAHLLLAEIAVSGKVVNEIDWFIGGRRMGPASESSSCVRCSASVVAAPPNVRLLRAHPAHPELKKRIIATIKMVPFNLTHSLKNIKDENAIVVQPSTYKEAVKKYGLEFKIITKIIRPSEEIEQRPDRFPLSEVTAVSFCPSDRYHHRIALATHAGFVFVFNASS